MAFVKQLEWLTSRFYVFFEVNPFNHTIIQVYDIDKFANPIDSSRRVYESTTLEKAISNAYNKEQK